MTKLEKGAVIESFEQLEQGLRDWTAFSDTPDYDADGMIALLCACVENLRKNVHATLIQDLAEALDDEERVFLAALAARSEK